MNKKLMLFNIGLIALSALFACSCSEKSDGGGGDKPTAEISFSVPEISVANAKTTQNVTVEASADWGVTSEDKSWCNVSPSGGIAGSSTIKVTIDENKTGDARETNLVFRIGKAKKLLPVRQNYRIESVEISDPAFKTYLLASFDTDKDGVLSSKEAAAVTRIEAKGLGIEAMPELNDFFTNLTWLDCSDNRLTELVVSDLTQMTHLDCSGNRLSTIDIQNLQSLKEFDATDNPDLKTIRVWNGFSAPAGFSKPDGASYVEPEINIPAGYKLVWQEEFNEAGTTSPLMTKWWYETGDSGWGNHELQDYVSGKYGNEQLAVISNGTLKIIAKKIDSKVRSIRMNTLDSWTYGYFEARLKLPPGKGTWPAFWMMPKNFKAWPDDGEIDIMEEVGYNPNRVSSSIHCKAYNHGIGTQKTNEIFISTAQSEFHTYALEWTEDFMKFYFDGKVHFTFTNDKSGNKDTWPFDAPFYLKLNLAWGGDWGGAQGIDESCLPATYEVDYVRVFKKLE